MSSQEEEDSSVASSSHDHSDDDWNGSDDNNTGGGAKKKNATVATAGRRQLARRPSKPRSTIGLGSYKYSSSDGSSDDDDDDDGIDSSRVRNNQYDKKEEAASSSESDSKPPPKKIQRQNKKIAATAQSKQSTAQNSNVKPRITIKNIKKPQINDSESEEEEEWDEDEKEQSEYSSESQSDSDSDFGAPSSNKRRGAAARIKKNTKAKKSSSSAAAATRTHSRRSTRQTYNEQTSSSSSEEEENIQYETTPSGTRRPRRSCSQQTKERMSKVVQQDMKTEREALGGVLEEDDKELLENSTLEEDSSNSDDNDDEGTNDNKNQDADNGRLKRGLRQNKVVAKGSAKRKRKLGDESTDEDYDENNSGSDQDDDDDDDDDDDFEVESDDNAASKRRSTRKQRRGGKIKPNYTEIDEDDIGTADEGTSDEENAPSILTSPSKKSMGSYGSPAVRKRARASVMGGRTQLDIRVDGSSEDDDDEEFKPSSKKSQETLKTRKRRPYMDSSDSDDNDEQEGGPTPHSGLRTTHINCSSLIDDITMMNLPKNKPHVCYVAPDGKTRHCFTLDTLYRIAISAKGDDDDRHTSTSSEPLKFLQPPHFRAPMEDDLIDQIASRFGRSALVIENSAVYKKIKGGRLGASNLDELDEFDEDGNFVGDDEEGNGVNFQDRFNRFITTLMGSSDVYCCPLCYIEADRRLPYQDDDEMVEDDESGDEQRNDTQVDRFAFVDDPLTILGNLDQEAFEVAATFCFRLLSGLKKHLKVVHGVNLSDIEGNDLFKRFQVRAGDGLLQRWLQKNLRRNTVQGDMMRYWNSGENQSFLLLLSQIDKTDPEYSSDFSLSFPNRARKVWNQVSAPYMKNGQDMDDFLADDDESEGSAAGVPINPYFTPPSNLKSGPDFKSPEEEMIENLQKRNRYKSALRGDSEGGDSSSSDEDELEILDPQPAEESEDDEWTKSKSFQAKVKQKSQSSNDSEDDVFDSDDEKPKAKTPTSARKRVMESSSDEESY